MRAVTVVFAAMITLVAAGCDLDSDPTGSGYAEVLRSLVACTAASAPGFAYGKGIYLGNNHDTAVWVLDQPTGLSHP